MSTLSFSIEAHSWEIKTLDLPVEVRRLDLEVQARGMVSDTLEVPPGTYMAVSHLPAGQELRAQVTVDEGERRKVTLQPNAWECSRHESEEVPLFIWGYRTASPTDIDADEKHDIATPDSVARHGLEGFVRVGGVAGYARAGFQPQLDPRPGPTRMRFPACTELDLLRVEQRDRDPAHIVLPSIRASRVPGHEPFMVGEDAGYTVVLLPAADGTVDCELHLLDLEADTMLQYLARGMIAEASVMTANVDALAEQLVKKKLANPTAAAAGAYVLLRLGALERLHDWTENLFNWFPSLPDGAAARGEHLARAGRHEEAAERFLALEDRGLPTMSDGLGYAIQRLELYAATRPDPVADRCQQLLEQLLPYAAATDFTKPFTTFAGRSPNEPGALSREHATLAPYGARTS